MACGTLRLCSITMHVLENIILTSKYAPARHPVPPHETLIYPRGAIFAYNVVIQLKVYKGVPSRTLIQSWSSSCKLQILESFQKKKKKKWNGHSGGWMIVCWRWAAWGLISLFWTVLPTSLITASLNHPFASWVTVTKAVWALGRLSLHLCTATKPEHSCHLANPSLGRLG